MGHLQRRFAGFRSASDCPRLQPDPVVLRQLDKRIELFTNEATFLHFSERFIGAMTDHFVEAFLCLDALARDNPFWDGTNRRPTQYKLGSFCEIMLRDNPTDCEALRLKVAVQTVGDLVYDPEPWERLASADCVDPTWIVNSALYAEYFGSYDTVSDLVKLLNKSGSWSRIKLHLDSMTIPNEQDRTDDMLLDRNRYSADWANRVLGGWSEG